MAARKMSTQLDPLWLNGVEQEKQQQRQQRQHQPRQQGPTPWRPLSSSSTSSFFAFIVLFSTLLFVVFFNFVRSKVLPFYWKTSAAKCRRPKAYKAYTQFGLYSQHALSLSLSLALSPSLSLSIFVCVCVCYGTNCFSNVFDSLQIGKLTFNTQELSSLIKLFATCAKVGERG